MTRNLKQQSPRPANMPDSFFERKRKRPSAKGEGSSGKDKRAIAPQSKSRINGKRRRNEGSESDSSDGGEGVGDAETMDLRHSYTHAMGSASEDEMEETPAQARVRLAKLYVDGMKRDRAGDAEGGADAAQADAENISSRLLGVAQSKSTHMNIKVAQLIKPPREDDVLGVRGHQRSVTCAAISLRGDSIFTASKDGTICRWGMTDGKLLSRSDLRPKQAPNSPNTHPSSSRVKTHLQFSTRSGAGRRRARRAMSSGSGEASTSKATASLGGASTSSFAEKEGHTDEVWSLSLSDDGTLLASGGKDRRVGLWAIEPRARAPETSEAGEGQQVLTASPRWVAGLSGHKDSITSLSFRVGSGVMELFSASLDRTLKLWDATQKSYIETFFGHQESCLSVSALRGELAASAGGRDKTIRWWKVRDESQFGIPSWC